MHVQVGKAESDHGADTPMQPLNSGSTDLHSLVMFVVDVNKGSLPLAMAMDDVLVAYGQNGEALRPDNGYPLRLVVPGWEGNVNVKWLRRLTVVDRPYMTRMESTGHASLMPDGKARQFTSSWKRSR